MSCFLFRRLNFKRALHAVHIQAARHRAASVNSTVAGDLPRRYQDDRGVAQRDRGVLQAFLAQHDRRAAQRDRSVPQAFWAQRDRGVPEAFWAQRDRGVIKRS